MATATEIIDADLNHWVPGTRFFSTSDDQHFVVCSDLTNYPTRGAFTYIRRQTAVLFCTPEATVTDMTPDHTFPPGTTAEQAITQLGYTLEEQ